MVENNQLELKFAMAEKDKAELQAMNAKLEAKNDKLHEENRMLQRQLGKYQGIQIESNHQHEINARLMEKIEQLSRELGKREGAEEILMRRLTDAETQNSQFLFGDDETGSKTSESVHGPGYYEKTNGEVEHDEMNGSEDYMSVASESQYSPLMNFVAEANSIQVQSHPETETSKRKKPKKIESKSIIKEKEFVAADRNKEPATLLPSSSSNFNGQGVEVRWSAAKKEGGARPKCDVCNKTFVNEFVLRRHYSSHQNKKWQCDYCGKYLSREDYMRIHQKKCEKAKQHVDLEQN